MQGLFVGLTTLDFIYLTERLPQTDEKLVAADYTIAAGGPATNAAVTFASLGNTARTISAVGSHPMASIVRSDLETYGVVSFDLDPDRPDPPPVSSILVTPPTGARSAISINATKSQLPCDRLPENPLQQVDVVLIDGHQTIVGTEVAKQAIARQIPVVVDGGSWKPGFEDILQYADYVVASANFFPPSCTSPSQVFSYLQGLGVPHVAITHGENPIVYWSRGTSGKLAVSSVRAIDTLGAGDIFHGAFCHFILQESFVEALASASKVAAQACQSFGTRSWLKGRSQC
ncbi:sugar kinase [Geitlerinema sp. CS-897]|nr:sugar kinase [Geitlerinema sp. CS-897]